MHIRMVMVASVNGRITKSGASSIHEWTSKEDAAHFSQQIAESNLIVMGSSTYDAVKQVIKPLPGKLRIILTHDPQKYSKDVIKDQLEFSNETPAELVNRFDQAGYEHMLLVGGGKINAAFLQSELVDEIMLTVEPYLFGTGKPLISENPVDITLQLESTQQLNEQGTLLLRYRVIH